MTSATHMPAWLRAAHGLSEVIFEGEDGPPPRERLDWLCAELGDFFSRVGWRSRLVFRVSLFVIGAVAPLLVLRPWPLRWHPLRRRAKALARFERSPFGMALFAVKAILCIVYYEHPDAAREIGVDSDCLVVGEVSP